jgi:uncharacterized beta-barrel protein YwiB (DUF1934 family)
MNQKISNAMIILKGTQNYGSEEENKIELVTEGSYLKTDNGFEVEYDETEITGMEGTYTTVNISIDKIILTRTGSINSEMIFEKGKHHVSYYDTSNGSLSIGITTNSLNVNINENGGEVLVEYCIEIDNVKTSNNDFHMIIRKSS